MFDRKDWIRGRLMASTLLTTCLAAAPLTAHAQQPAQAAPPAKERVQVDEVVVTATKRSESIQSVPMAITAFSSKVLVESGVTSFQDYAVEVPNLSFAYTGELGAQAQTVAIRGIFGANTTGFYIDDTPLPESLDPRVLDLSRIEVLKGPQGTLYGARSEGGTIRLITNQPDATEEEGYLHVVGSGTEHGGQNASIDGAINLPVIKDVLAIRVSAFSDDQSGVFDRVASPDAPVAFPKHDGIDASHHSGGSVSASLNLLDDTLVITPRVLIEHATDTGHPYADYTASNFTQARLFDLDEPGSDQFELYSLTAKYKLPFGDIVSDTSEFNRRSTDSEDSSEVVSLFFGTPATPVLFHVLANEHDFSEEVRFISRFSGPLQITLGAFYQNSNQLGVSLPTPDGVFIDNIYSSQTSTRVTEEAVFGEATFDVTPKLRLIGGGRWFDNKVTLSGSETGAAVTPGTFNGAQRQSDFDPKLGVQYKVTKDDLVYVTAAKGFRIGGVNTYPQTLCNGALAAIGLSPQDANTYKSDSVWSYEVGAKTSWLQHRLTLDAALFDIEWSGVQQVAALSACGVDITVNGGHARSQGGELTLAAALTDALRLSVGMGYTDARITDAGPTAVVPVGQPIQQVPKWTFTSSLDYHVEIAGLPTFSRVEVDYVGSSLSENNSVQFPVARPSYVQVKLRAGFDIRNLELAAFVDNATNSRANLSDVLPEAIELPGRPRIATNRPLTAGLDARLKF